MRVFRHAAVITAFAIVAAVIVFARPNNKTTAPATSLSSVQVAVSQK
jgi:hypothetical protein